MHPAGEEETIKPGTLDEPRERARLLAEDHRIRARGGGKTDENLAGATTEWCFSRGAETGAKYGVGQLLLGCREITELGLRFCSAGHGFEGTAGRYKASESRCQFGFGVVVEVDGRTTGAESELGTIRVGSASRQSKRQQ